MTSLSPALYSRFSDQERLKLVLEALTRKDLNEAARLHESCPRSAFKILTTEYHRIASTLLHIAHAFEIEILPHLIKLEIFAGFHAILARASASAHLSVQDAVEFGRTGSVEVIGSDDRMKRMSALEDHDGADDVWGLSEPIQKDLFDAAVRSRAALTAFERFCRECAELRPALVLHALCPATERKLAELRDYLEAAQVDEEWIQRHLNRFNEVWSFREARC
jgi:hypothetical protein